MSALNDAERYLLYYQEMTGLSGLPVSVLPTEESQNSSVSLDHLKEQFLKEFEGKLLPGATQFVYGEGNPRADLLFIGEAPGADEDRLGRPFVGKAGQLLTKIIEAMGRKREDVYITNVVKCRPPNNRTPLPNEMDEYFPTLLKQIEAIEPKVIVALGGVAAKALLQTAAGQPETGITRLRGSFKPFPHSPEILVMPTFHPAYLLRNPDGKRFVWDDMKKVMAALESKGL